MEFRDVIAVIVLVFAIILYVVIIIALKRGAKVGGHGESKTQKSSFFTAILERSAGKQFISCRDEPQLKDLFWSAPGVDKNKLLVTREGLYSITPPNASNSVVDVIQTELGRDLKDMTITDATAGMGGNTIQFARRFKHVNAVEINSTNMVALKNNVSVYGFDPAITFYEEDYTKIMLQLHQDVVFMDPPWKGLDYRDSASMPLDLSGIQVYDIVNQLHGSCSMVVIKVPTNFAVDEFRANSKHAEPKIVAMRKFKLLLLKFV